MRSGMRKEMRKSLEILRDNLDKVSEENKVIKRKKDAELKKYIRLEELNKKFIQDKEVLLKEKTSLEETLSELQAQTVLELEIGAKKALELDYRISDKIKELELITANIVEQAVFKEDIRALESKRDKLSGEVVVLADKLDKLVRTNRFEDGKLEEKRVELEREIKELNEFHVDVMKCRDRNDKRSLYNTKYAEQLQLAVKKLKYGS